ncbi:hypothetical protein E6C27_scaffold57G002350 [Cucumis melo var. makuwa]|uniref:Uncharacterized protein n=1 Tax=Cucumis melo var. makuwa TaxID=1194695 RepID=A0A5A7SZ05_CUCMM|nr:hypothetical protein E6C27_scaffold57G002350 [Cucumis melo var. makuwa]
MGQASTQGKKPFLRLIEQLCIKACPELEKSPQVEVSDGVCTKPTLHRIIAIHKNKAKLKCLKTKQKGQKVVKSMDSEEEEKREKSKSPTETQEVRRGRGLKSSTKSKISTKSQASPQSQKSKPIKSKSPPSINDLTITSLSRHESNKDRAPVSLSQPKPPSYFKRKLLNLLTQPLSAKPRCQALKLQIRTSSMKPPLTLQHYWMMQLESLRNEKKKRKFLRRLLMTYSKGKNKYSLRTLARKVSSHHINQSQKPQA